MLLRLLLIAALIVAAFRFVGKLIRAILGTLAIGDTRPRKKPPASIDESQIQDADFEDL